MTPLEFFSFQPCLKPHTIAPADEAPAEFKIILDEDGSCLGLTAFEHEAVQWMNGETTLGRIAAHVAHENRVSLSLLRRLLWDLDRYGFFQQSPWQTDNRHAPGYWGVSAVYWKPFAVTRLFGSWDRILGRVLAAPLATLVLFLMIGVFGVWGARVDHSGTWLIVEGSTAKAGLVLVLGMLGGFGGAWLITFLILRSIHHGPVQLVADFRYGLPLLRIDARRLRRLACGRALCAALNPILALFGVAAFCWWAAKIGGANLTLTRGWQGWLQHLALAITLSGAVLLNPWSSTVFTRELSLGLRNGRAYRLMVDSIKKLFASIVRPPGATPTHYWLQIAWGGWAMLYILLLLQALLSAAQWEFQPPIARLLREDNRLTVFVFFAILAVFSAAAAASGLTLLVSLMVEAGQELRRRYWPRHDRRLAALMIIMLLLVLTPAGCLITPMHQTNMAGLALFCGTLWLLFTGMSWKQGGWCYETAVHLPLVLAGISLLLDGYHLLTPPASGVNVAPVNSHAETSSAVWSSQRLAQGVLLSGLLVYWGYLLGCLFWLFRPPARRKAPLARRIGGSAIWLAGIGLLLWKMPPPSHIVDDIGRTLSWIVLLHLTVISLWWGGLRNGSNTLLGVAMLLLTGGLLYETSRWPLVGPPHFLLWGTGLLAAGLLLRESAASKTALGVLHPPEFSPLTEWRTAQLGEEFQQAAVELFNAEPNLPVPHDVHHNTLRNYLRPLHRLAGTQALRAAARRVAWNLPWHETQLFANLLPVAVSFPPLSLWTPERIQRKLRHVPTFAAVPEEELRAIASITRFAIYYPGDMLIHQHDQEGDLFIIADGWVTVEQNWNFGHTILAILGPNDFVGEIGFLSGGERTASVRALQPTLALRIHRRDIEPSLRETFHALQSAESGQSWQLALSQAQIFREFLPSLNARVYLESQRVLLDRGQTLWLDSEECRHKAIVFLSGSGVMILEKGERLPLNEGQIIGLKACFQAVCLSGQIRTERPSRLLLVDQSLLLEALSELLTPKELFNFSAGDITREATYMKGRFRFS